jgi:cysteine desulfurase
MSANHEVGTVQPVNEVVSACQAAGVPLLVDAAQSVGRMRVPPGWSLLAASARKWGGPTGVGVLVVRRVGEPVFWHDPRPTPPATNIPLLVAAAASLRAVSADAAGRTTRDAALIDRIRACAATIPDVEVFGDPTHRLPHLVTLSCLYVDGEALVHALAREGFAVASGSACTSDTLLPSHVLAAMGVTTHGNIRISLHPATSEAEVTRFVQVLPATVARLREEAGVSGL